MAEFALVEFKAKSLKIGLENSLNCDDLPAIRIVPNANEFTSNWEQDVYFSVILSRNLDQLDLEAEFSQIYALERRIREKLHNFQWQEMSGLIRFIKTTRRESEHYLMIESEFKVIGVA